VPTIIKRSGKEEDFDIEKVKHSIAAASDELKRPFNVSDLNRLARCLEELLKGKEKITSREISIYLIGLMHLEGHPELAESYINGGRQ